MLKPIFPFIVVMVALPQMLLGQLYIGNNATPSYLAQMIMPGNSAIITNVNYTGNDSSIGYFLANNTLGFTTGIVLTTGRAIDAIGPNNSHSSGIDVGAPSSNQGPSSDHDHDLDSVIQQNYPSVYSNDAAVLEFDFTSTANTVVFNYVFGSEEYPAFVASINDIFAIFINGPNLSKRNLALVPGTALPVSIDNVNSSINSNYYVSNIDSSIQYNAYTTPLIATAIVEPGVTYHLKIAIADASDGLYDSGVFIGANASFINSTTENSAQTQLTLYPNPANEFATLAYNFPSQANANMVVFDGTGRMVYTSALPGNIGTAQIPTDNLPAGIYHIKVSAGNEKLWMQKLVVVK